MAEVTGPISTLPGARHALPEGTMCDSHPDRPAVARIQGETDSMGCELNDLCAECVEEMKNDEPMRGHCDWCKTPDQVLKPRRDYEEGMSGPVYYVCQPCITKDNARIAEELADEDDGYDFDSIYDNDDGDDYGPSDFIDEPEPEPERPDPNVKFSDAAAEYRAQRRDEEQADGDGWRY